MTPPIKEKYIDEAFKPLFILGNNPIEGTVCVCNANEEVISLPKDVAEKVVEINREYMTKLYDLLGFKQC